MQHSLGQYEATLVFWTNTVSNKDSNNLIKSRLIYYYVTANKGWFGVIFLNGGQKLFFYIFDF